MMFLDRVNNKNGPGFTMFGTVVDIRLLKQMAVGLASVAGALGGILIDMGTDVGTNIEAAAAADGSMDS
jgi:hypothetical protein